MIGGSYVPYYIGRTVYLLSPVSISEWETYEMLISKDMAWYLIYCSLHRANKSVTMKQAKRIVRWHKESATYMIKVICSISLPPDKEYDSKELPSAKEVVQQIKVLYRTLSRLFGWTPQQISQMSPLQLYDYMIGGEDGTGVVRMSPAQYQQFRHSRELKNG